MNGQIDHPSGIAQLLIPIAAIAVVFAIRARRMTQTRPLRVGQLWIVPAIYLVLCIAAMMGSPPGAAGWLALVGGVAIGALIGWWRGRFTHIDVDPATGTLRQRTSPVGMLVLLGLVVAKSGLRTGSQGAHLDWLGDMLLGMAVGTLTAVRAEVWLRAKRVMAAASARA